LQNNAFALVYQPIMPIRGNDFTDVPSADGTLWARYLATKTPRAHYFEVLLRMQAGTDELVLPNAFLPTAERYNLMFEIDKWVVNEAFKALRDTAFKQRIGLSINLSAQSLGSNQIGQYVLGKLVEYNIEPNLITFEITETKALNNLQATQALISTLRAVGCRFALDDFGSGFSSFTHLKDLEVDYLKIDGQFTQGLADDPVDRAVVNAITAIAHSVGKRTTAEYVDRPELIPFLREAGVDFLQGYYVGPPTRTFALPLLPRSEGQMSIPEAPPVGLVMLATHLTPPPIPELSLDSLDDLGAFSSFDLDAHLG
jgi:EAL domain-containing protein (putative c-di-GMP-specific phosphodiesterase class I)